MPLTPRLRFILAAFPALALAYALEVFVGPGALAITLLALPAVLRRLRETGLPIWLAALVVVPIANAVFALVLALLRGDRVPRSRIARIVPASVVGSAIVGALLTAALGAVLTFVSANLLGVYGFALFLGVPFCLGLFSAVVFGLHEPRSVDGCLLVGIVSVAIANLALIFVALEGAICVLMALPLTVTLGVLGSLVGYFTQRRDGSHAGAGVACAAVLVLPALMGVETLQAREPALRAITSALVIDAPPAVVWRHVVSVEPLPPPRELIFRVGIAYPTRATISGRGVGAVRRCTFSTGDFVEPITVWEPGRLLEFAVTEQPPPMRELSPYGDVDAPHLDGFLRSERGRFELVPLAGGRTLLRGTSWYRNRMWPATYWGLWSDALIRRIHMRVLRHIEQLAEGNLD